MGDRFPMDERLWRQNVDDDPNHDAAGVFVALDGEQPVGAAVARVCRVPLGQAPLITDKGWLNSIFVHPANRRKGVGRQLLEQAEGFLKERGVPRAESGGDPGHFFPGVPATQESAMAFLQACGYAVQGKPAFDVMQDISDFKVPVKADRAMATNLAFRFTSCNNKLVPALLEFLEREFSGRWLYETERRLAQERAPQDIMLLVIGSRVVGFAHTFHNGSARLGPSVYWRKLLGAQYGGLGPMGVAKEVRGQGMGFALLCEATERLRVLGVKKMAIDWTVLLDFYGEAGFKPWKEYRSFFKLLV